MKNYILFACLTLAPFTAAATDDICQSEVKATAPNNVVIEVTSCANRSIYWLEISKDWGRFAAGKYWVTNRPQDFWAGETAVSAQTIMNVADFEEIGLRWDIKDHERYLFRELGCEVFNPEFKFSLSWQKIRKFDAEPIGYAAYCF